MSFGSPNQLYRLNKQESNQSMMLLISLRPEGLKNLSMIRLELKKMSYFNLLGIISKGMADLTTIYLMKNNY